MMELAWSKEDSGSSRFGLGMSIGLHAVILGGILLWSHFAGPPFFVAAGPGEGGEGGGGAIQVGVSDTSAVLGFARPVPLSQVGEEKKSVNNAVLEHEKEESPDSEVLVPPKPETPNAIKTKRPVANQEERLFTGKTDLAKSQSNSAMVGRTFGSATPTTVGGIAVGPAGPGVGTGLPGGSQYGRLIQQILSRNYNPPAIASAQPEYVIIELHIARDGTILSVSGGRVIPRYFKRRSPIELVNYAAERAILVSKLPPFPVDFLRGSNEAAAEIWFKYPK
jgi:hypothetical protein